MQTMTATLMSTEDIVDLRRWAGEALDAAGPGDEYVARRVAACRDTLDWVEGARGSAPVSGLVVDATPDNLERESVRAMDDEDTYRRRQERGTYPGTVHVTLEWMLGRADAPF